MAFSTCHFNKSCMIDMTKLSRQPGYSPHRVDSPLRHEQKQACTGGPPELCLSGNDALLFGDLPRSGDLLCRFCPACLATTTSRLVPDLSLPLPAAAFVGDRTGLRSCDLLSLTMSFLGLAEGEESACSVRALLATLLSATIRSCVRQAQGLNVKPCQYACTGSVCRQQEWMYYGLLLHGTQDMNAPCSNATAGTCLICTICIRNLCCRTSDSKTA